MERIVSMLPDEWRIVDRERGDLPRGKYLASLLFGPALDIEMPEDEEIP